MKKILLSVLALTSFGISAQTTIFQDSFETYTDFAIANVGLWTLIDVDKKNTYLFSDASFVNEGVQKSFQIFNAEATVPALVANINSNWTAKTGNKIMVCFSASTPAPALNNDWLISPEVTLGSSGNVLSFWAKACDTRDGLEKFRVGISSGKTTANVTLLSNGTITTLADIVYVQYSYNIPITFNSQNVYFSINCVSNDQFGFAVDDFRVTATTLGTTDFFKNNFSFYPNPSSDVVSISNKNNISIDTIELTDVNGRIIKNIDANTVSFSVKELNAGMYFIRVSTPDGVGTTKLIKQ